MEILLYLEICHFFFYPLPKAPRDSFDLLWIPFNLFSKKIDPKIGVIMVTAVIDEELAKRALELGADDYITKPIDFDYLETCVMVKLAQLAG